jgi:DNA repair exonuclease SbcCD ATPase subunit
MTSEKKPQPFDKMTTACFDLIEACAEETDRLRESRDDYRERYFDALRKVDSISTTIRKVEIEIEAINRTLRVVPVMFLVNFIALLLIIYVVKSEATDETKPPQVIQTKQSDSAWMEAPST